MVTPILGQLDYSSGTNAVIQLAGTVSTSAGIMLPVVVGIILLMSAIGLYYRFARKAKVGT